VKFKGFALLFLALFLLFSIAVKGWADRENRVDIDRQRELYEQAVNALAKRSLRQFQDLKSSLHDYPLYPYLEYGELSVLLHHATTGDIQGFLDKYGDTPLATRLRIQWLERLQGRDRWRDFLAFYTPDVKSTEFDCFYQRARYRSGARQEALEAGLVLWQVGQSQPESCDPLFHILIQQGMITEEIAWKRYSQAVLNHQYQLARYLERFFKTPKYRLQAQNFISVDRNSRVIGNYNLFKEHTPEVMLVIEHGITHLAHTNSDLALNHWNRYQHSHDFDPAARSRILARLVKALYEQGHQKAADNYLDESLDLATVDLLEWRLRRAIGEGDWPTVAPWLEKLPPEIRSSSRWQYWQARSQVLNAIEPGQFDAVHNHVHAIYEQLSKERSYYGFLASEWLESTHQMQHQPVTVSEQQIDSMAAGSGFQRIRELLFHGDLLAARREWQLATADFNEQNWLVAANLAKRWQWHDKAIMSMVHAGYWNDIDIRFPLPYTPVFEKNAEKNDIPLNLLFALSRQESAFGPDAASVAGARGLMQLMPGTASQTARKNGIPYTNSKDLEQPEINVRIGATYYRELLDRFDNNRILATAAYNAGPQRVDRWLNETGGRLPFDAWVEAIPFLETRNYVQNVLAFSTIYAHHLGNDKTMLSEHERLVTL